MNPTTFRGQVESKQAATEDDPIWTFKPSELRVLGIPEWLTALGERFHAALLPQEEVEAWPTRFAEAIPVGATQRQMDQVRKRFVLHLLLRARLPRAAHDVLSTVLQRHLAEYVMPQDAVLDGGERAWDIITATFQLGGDMGAAFLGANSSYTETLLFLGALCSEAPSGENLVSAVGSALLLYVRDEDEEDIASILASGLVSFLEEVPDGKE